VGVEGVGPIGVLGKGFGSNLLGTGVWGVSVNGDGVRGESTRGNGGFFQSAGTGIGVVGYVPMPDSPHVISSNSVGVYGECDDDVGGVGVMGRSFNSGVIAFNSRNRNAAYLASGCCAAYLVGDVVVTGKLSNSSGGFLIDHPLDPASKFLSHSFVESPDMKNVYDGVVMLDTNGEAAVDLPEWFEILNTDFRYQLTCIGSYAPVYISQEIKTNSFRIAGGLPNIKVSWQVTGIRQDAWASAHRIQAEEEKAHEERGSYLHPELYGAPSEKSIERVRHPLPPQMTQTAEANPRDVGAS
jgi:trimeric autotransporter adhesin